MSEVIRHATLEDAREAAELYAAAYATNPAFGAIFASLPDDETKWRARVWFFQRRLSMLIEAGCIVLLARSAEDGRLLCSMVAVPPRSQPSLWAKLRWGIALWPYLWGLTSLRTAMALDDQLVGAGPDQWEFVQVAVLPSEQGRGLGSRVLARLLDEVRARGAVSICLETQTDVAMRWYERFGFVTVDSRLVAVEAPAEPFVSHSLVWKEAPLSRS